MTDISLERSLPCSIDSERSVLGAILLDENAFFRASEILRPEDYYLESHRKVFLRMTDLKLESRGLDTMTLVEELRRHNELEAAGGIGYLLGLTDGMPRAVNVEHYARTVKEKATLRLMIQLSNETMTRCYQAEDLPAAILEDHEASVFRIAAREVTGGFRSLDDLVTTAYREIEEAANRKTTVIGIETGFASLDHMTGGLCPEDLIIVAARPGLGKTSLCLNIACHAALKKRKHVGIFSLEMGGVQLAKLRMLASEAEVDANKIRSGFLNRDDWARLGRAAGELSQAPIWIDDSAHMSMTQLRAKAQRLALEKGLDLLIIDYLQLMAGDRRYENRNQEVTAISRGCKQLAKELHIPVIAISQLNRDVERGGKNRRPQLSDLRESGAIEQDADLVLFIYREEMCNPTDENSGVAEFIIGKQRNGGTGSFQMAFIKQFTKFANLYTEESAQPKLY